MRDVTCLASRSQNPPTYGYLYIHKESETLQATKKPSFRRAWGLEAHRYYEEEVDRWCNDDCNQDRVMLAKLFHMILLKVEPVSRLLGLLADHSYLARVDALALYQVILEVARCTVTLEGAEVHGVTDNPLDHVLNGLLLANFTFAVFHSIMLQRVKRDPACAGS